MPALTHSPFLPFPLFFFTLNSKLNSTLNPHFHLNPTSFNHSPLLQTHPHPSLTTMSDPTSIFGLNSWVVAGIILGVAIVLLLFFLSLCLTSRRARRSRRPPFFAKPPAPSSAPADPRAAISIPQVSKEIQEIVQLQHRPEAEADCEEGSLIGGYNRVHVEIGGKDNHRISCPGRGGGGGSSNSQDSGGGGGGGGGHSGDQAGVPEVSHLGWGHWYTLRELERCTNGFDDGNVIGEGGYGIVYYGVLDDGLQVAVKNLLNNR